MKKIHDLENYPYPIVCRYRMMQDEVSGLKKNYIKAFSLLINSFEIYLQLTAYIPIMSCIQLDDATLSKTVT